MTFLLHTFEGGNALSPFKTRQLLPRLQAISERISGLGARFVHLAAFEAEPEATTLSRLAELLTYGEPVDAAATAPGGYRVLVSPRLGTVS